MRTERVGHMATTGLLVATCLVLSTLAFGLYTQRFRVLPVLTGSMQPMIDPGDLVVTTPKPVREVRSGDVIVFHPPGDDDLVVHRVVDVSKGASGPTIRTKGDDNDSVDPWNAELQGEVAWEVSRVIPKVGHAAVLAKRPNARIIAIVGAALVFLYVTLQGIWTKRDDVMDEGVGDAVAPA